MTIFKISLPLLGLLALPACSGGADVPEADNVTETRMDEVDVIDGTISDDVIDVDTQKETDPKADGEDADGSRAEDGDSQEAEQSEETS